MTYKEKWEDAEEEKEALELDVRKLHREVSFLNRRIDEIRLQRDAAKHREAYLRERLSEYMGKDAFEPID